MILITGTSGGLQGPAASTDDGIARWDGTAGDSFGEPTSSGFPTIADNGVMTTVAFGPDVDNSRDVGAQATRFGATFVNRIQASDPPGAGTLTTGTSTKLAGCHFSGGNPAGRTFQSTGVGAFAHGQVHAANTATARMTSSNFGSATFGSSYATGTANAAVIEATLYGSFAGGQATASSGDATIQSTASGALAWGYAQSYGAGGVNAFVTASGQGSLAQGRATKSSGASGDARISASGNGAFAQGEAVKGGTVNAQILASGAGSMARGCSSSSSTFASTVEALGDGAFACGFADGATAAGSLSASGDGSVCFGLARNGTIAATADNSMQMGIGSNGLADSFRMGVAWRFKFTTGAPGTPANGDCWVNGGSMYVHTNGVTKNLDSI